MDCKSLDLNPIDHLMDLLKRKVRAQPLQDTTRMHALETLYMCKK